MNRPSKEETFLHIAAELAQQSTCRRRAVGCVLVDTQWDVVGMGYNGAAVDQPHCLDQPCAGAELASGEGLDLCEAIHAEQNALLRCRDVRTTATALVTTAPCTSCIKLLLNTSCQRIVFVEPYAHDNVAKKLWTRAGRSWEPWAGEMRISAPIQERSEIIK